MTVKSIEKSILNLKPVEQIRIVENVLASLHGTNLEVEQAWVAVAEKRFADYKKGKVKAIPLDKVKALFCK